MRTGSAQAKGDILYIMKKLDTKSNKNKLATTRDMPSKGSDALRSYTFPKLKVTVQATSLAEAQLKADAKAEKLQVKSNNN